MFCDHRFLFSFIAFHVFRSAALDRDISVSSVLKSQNKEPQKFMKPVEH